MEKQRVTFKAVVLNLRSALTLYYSSSCYGEPQT